MPREWMASTPTVATFVVYAGVAGWLAPYTWPASVATAGAGVAAAAAAIHRGWLRRRHHEAPPEEGDLSVGAIVVWAALIGAVVVFQVAMFMSAPRDTYPTLSSLAGAVFDVPGLRVVAFGFWLWVGWYLVWR